MIPSMLRKPTFFFLVALAMALAGCNKDSAGQKWEREHNTSDPGNDPRMKAAEAEAIKRWPEFTAAFAHRDSSEGFAVKGRFVDGASTEWMWIEVASVQSGSVSGKIDNDPVYIHNVKFGDAVTVKLADIDDWIYKDAAGMHGGFTSKVLQQIDDEKKAQQK